MRTRHALAELTHVVAVGASAGGLEALLELLAPLPPRLPFAMLVVIHRSAGRHRQMHDVIARGCSVPVKVATSGTKIHDSCLFILPAHLMLQLKDGRLVSEKSHAFEGRPIDVLFMSLAREHAPRSLGILLSGADSDGTAGMVALKASGALTLCQDMKTARFPTMPQSAITAGAVDFIMAPDQMGGQIIDIIENPTADPMTRNGHISGEPVDGQALTIIFKRLQQAFSLDFSLYKRTTILRRIRRRMSVVKCADMRDYAELLNRSPSEIHALYDDLLIKVTSFFREKAGLEALTQIAFPAIFKDRPSDEAVRVWVAGCATGEQAYTVAIMLFEYMRETRINYTLQVFATDISEEALKLARAGCYNASVRADIPADLIERYFTLTDEGLCIGKTVRKACIFARQNVTQDPPFSRLDLVVCTNVLIYLEARAQRRLIPLFHYAIRPGGFLLLGASESVGSHPTLFTLMHKRQKLYARKQAPIDVDFDFTPASTTILSLNNKGEDLMSPQRPSNPGDLGKEVDRLLLSRYAPAGVIVDENFDVVQFRGRTGQFLESPSGPVTLNIFKMAREGLGAEMRAALHEARDHGRPAHRAGLRVKSNGGFTDVNLDVLPIVSKQKELYFVVTFDPAPARPVTSRVSGKKVHPEILRLQTQLDESREDMQAIIEEKEASNEELKAANEEIQSSNEELQSTNEELQTAKEELQSANEELTTINEELQTRNVELNELNDDLNNLLSNVTIALVILGPDLRIRRYTPMAERLFNLIPSDIGRPVTDMNGTLELDGLPQLVGEVLHTLNAREVQVRDRGGHWYAMRLRPYRTSHNKIEGVVIALFEVDELRKMEQRARSAAALVNVFLQSAAQMYVIIDATGKVEAISEALAGALKSDRSRMVGAPAGSLPKIGPPIETMRLNLDNNQSWQHDTVEVLPGRSLEIRISRVGPDDLRCIVMLDWVVNP